MEKRSYDTPLTILLWILIILIILDFISRIVLVGILFSSGILDAFMEMLGM